MNTQYLLLGGFAAVVALSLLIGAWGRRRSTGTLVSFFWGDNNFSVAQGTHLNLSTSFAINGVLYSAWLGYRAGWASVLPQVVWCAGFLFLARYAKRLAHLSRTGTLHGNIGYVFGKWAARWAAVASIIGFTLLFGWELYIGASMFKTVTASHSPNVESVLYFSLAAIAAIYCMLGGLRGNMRANEFQNYLSGTALVVAIIYLGWFALGTKPFAWHDFVDFSTLSTLATELTLAGIITNAVLFMVYQFLDMSVWQNIAAVSDEGRRPKRTLLYSSFWILVFPGITGSALGMLMRSHVTGIDPNNIVPELLLQVSSQPVIFTLLVMGFFAMMLSTVDGLLLAACQAVTWDLFHRKAVLQILTAHGTPDFSASDIVDARSFSSKLETSKDPVAEYLWSQLSSDTKTVMSDSKKSAPNLASEALVADLNKVIKSKSLYDKQRFDGVKLSEETEEALKLNPAGDDLVVLNRWLLEDAYPSDLSYNQFSKTLRKEGPYLGAGWKLRQQELKEKESRILDHSKYVILLIALVGGAITLYLVRGFGVNSFNLLYITYVAQMSLFPAIWVILHGENRPQSRGALSIGIGLLAGFAAVVYGLFKNPAVATWAPFVAVAVACLLYWPFRKFSPASKDLRRTES
jgi:hypothetical protein